MLGLLISAILGFQSISISPNIVEIPPNVSPIDLWPNFESSPNVAYQTFTITYNVGPNGFAQNGKLQIMLGYDTGHNNGNNPAFDNNFGWMQVPTNATSQSPIGRPQIKTSSAANYTTASCQSSTFKRKIVSRGSNLEAILEIQANSAIAPNDNIVVVFGDTTSGSPGATISWMPGKPSVVIFEDENNDGVFAPVQCQFPELLFTGKDVDSFIINAPMFCKTGFSQQVTVLATQGRDYTPESFICPVEDFNDDIYIMCSDPSASCPKMVQSGSWNHGLATFYITFNSSGYHTIRVMQKNHNNTSSLSNTIYVNNMTPYTIYCGDLQRHSSEGGHASIPDNMVWQRLFDRNDDFGCVIQHSEYVYAGFDGANTSRSIFQNAVDPLEVDFISFPGYEWSLVGNHRHVVYKNATSNPALIDNPYTGSETSPTVLVQNVPEFMTELLNQPGEKIAIAHHTLWNKSNFPDEEYNWAESFINNVQPLVEIYSKHGSSERRFSELTPFNYVLKHNLDAQRPLLELASVADALRLGYKIGIVGGSDEHSYASYSSGNADSDYCRPGNGFVISRESILSRDAIWNALTRKQTYATTGAKIHVIFTANNQICGSTIHDTNCIFNIKAHASSVNSQFMPNINLIEIYRDGYDVVYRNNLRSTKTPYVNITWQDPNPLNDGNEHSYFLKIYQDDNHLAWSSPIWWLKL